MKLCDMKDSEIENKYGPMIRAAGYAGTMAMITELILWDEDESCLAQYCKPPGFWMRYDTAVEFDGDVGTLRPEDSIEAAKHDGGAGVVVAPDGTRIYWQD